MTKSIAPDYVVVGAICHDLTADGWRWGGTATYSALTATQLGLSVGVLTSAEHPEESPLANRAGILWCSKASARTTTFENVYANGGRQQYLRAVAEPLVATDLPLSWREARIAHLGPIADDVSMDIAQAFPHALLGLTPQGWLRAWDGDGRVYARGWESLEPVLGRADVVVIGPEDLGGDWQQIEALRARCRLLVVTLGPQGAMVCTKNRQERVPAYIAQEVDPTGAGDVFATAFMIRLAETDDPIESARFANCVASFVIEAVGPANLPTRAQVDQRMKLGLLR